ncbi:PAS-domain containing protein [Thalassobaculum sp. OXR-137]|uniref:PAS-domain containing protein n=1 Tax=Thalassobaculum sp. OXR-137 TaxID=3100173 RepID=UPI002AC9B50A|nr:PAS-domain containing protein [Thalassobaculum sp. OXR-137]WPZ36218.1 PAS-domain containing protein [Thalassobaculum sp. OXR-137]
MRRRLDLLSDALNTMDDALSIYDGDDRFVFGNESFFRMYPFLRERGDIVGHGFEELLRFSLARDLSLTEEEREHYVQRRLAARRDGAPIPERQVPDGTWYLVKETYSPNGLTVTTRLDITARKQTELTLAATTTVLQVILDTMPNPLIAFDKDNYLVAWNRGFEALVELSPGDLTVGRPLVGVAKDIIRRVPSTESGIKRMFRAIARRGGVEFEWEREGSEIYQVIGRPMPDGGYLSMWRDLTLERRAEALATATQARLLDAIETMSEGFALFDRNDRLVLSNAQYKEMYGLPQAAFDESWTFERLVRYTLARDQYPEARGREEAWVAERLERHRNPPKTGFLQPISDGRTILVSENRTQEGGVVGMRSDITDRIEVETALRRARDALAGQTRSLRQLANELDEARRRAEEADAAKSRFLAMMSHELRTPMTGLLGMIELLSRTSLDSDQTGFIDIMRNSADTLLALLNDILDYSKLEAGKVQLEEIPFSPAVVLNDVVRLFQIPATAKGIAVEGRIGDDVPPWLLGDPLRLKQILSNLVSNGLKFTNEGSVTVSLMLGGERDGRVEILGAVEDTGIGIPSEVQGQLFAAFEQGAANTSRQFGGTGLGLSICKRLVEGMDGWISLESTQGTGSVFSFCVVMQPSEQPVVEPAVQPMEEDGEPIHILLAEDNEVNRMLVSRMLAKAGHRIDEAADGAEAVQAVRRRVYDLVLMDMQMPVMDGPDATREIRAMGGDRAQMPIVALTADAIPEHRTTYLAAGLDDVLLKPVDWGALNRTISWASRRRREQGAVSDGAGVENEMFAVPAFDRARVRAAVGSLPPARAVEMIALVPQEALRQLTLLERAVEAGDIDRVRQLAHAMKGLAANFGAVLMERAAARFHDAGHEIAKLVGCMADLRRAVAATREQAPAVIAEFEASTKD